MHTHQSAALVMYNVSRVMETLPVQELPPLVFQLLVLSSKGHKSLVLHGLKTLFNGLDQESAQGRDNEGDE